MRAAGTNPDRVLITGDGAATGRGVRTHDLGLPGFLARSLTERTGRATDVDILVEDGMTSDDCGKAVPTLDLDQYDIIVLSIGANEALSLVTPKKWQQSVATTTRAIRKATPSATRIFLLAIPQYGVNPHFPRRLADVVDHHVGVMNTITEHFAESLPGVIFVPESRDQAYELENAHVYHQWSESIADRI